MDFEYASLEEVIAETQHQIEIWQETLDYLAEH